MLRLSQSCCFPLRFSYHSGALWQIPLLFPRILQVVSVDSSDLALHQKHHSTLLGRSFLFSNTGVDAVKCHVLMLIVLSSS